MTSRSAFPYQRNNGFHESGMSLRDYLAAKALQGLLSNPGGPVQASPINGWHFCNCTPADVAREAYGLADAMLEAREAAL